METKGNGLGLVDRTILIGCIPLGVFMLYFILPMAFKDESEFALKLIFFGPLILLGISISIVGLLAQLTHLVISERQIRYKLFFRDNKIEWNEIKEIVYPVSVGRGGFSHYALFKTFKGKNHFIPCSGRELQRAIIDLQVKHLNQGANQSH